MLNEFGVASLKEICTYNFTETERMIMCGISKEGLATFEQVFDMMIARLKELE